MSETYPWAWYSDPAVCARSGSGSSVRPGTTSATMVALPEPSSYFASRPAGCRSMVTRDREGELRAFVNVCRHRGSEIASGEGRRETLQCPYHAWTYGLDGRLRSAPRAASSTSRACRARPAPARGVGAVSLRLCRPGGAVPVSASCALPFDPATLVFRERVDYGLEANWKIAVENYLECYHCPVAHPGFSSLVDVDPDAYRLEATGALEPVRQGARAATASACSTSCGPALKINIYPGFVNLSIGPVWPESPEPNGRLPRLLLRRGRGRRRGLRS